MFNRRILSGFFLFLFLTYLHFEETSAHPLSVGGILQSNSLSKNKKTGRKSGRSVVHPMVQLPLISIQADDDELPAGVSSLLDNLEIGVKNEVRSRSSRSSKLSCEDKVKKVIAQQMGLDLSDLVPGASIVDDLGADSLDSVEIILGVEEATGVDIPDEDAEKIKTVEDLINYVCNN